MLLLLYIYCQILKRYTWDFLPMCQNNTLGLTFTWECGKHHLCLGLASNIEMSWSKHTHSYTSCIPVLLVSLPRAFFLAIHWEKQSAGLSGLLALHSSCKEEWEDPNRKPIPTYANSFPSHFREEGKKDLKLGYRIFQETRSSCFSSFPSIFKFYCSSTANVSIVAISSLQGYSIILVCLFEQCFLISPFPFLQFVLCVCVSLCLCKCTHIFIANFSQK